MTSSTSFDVSDDRGIVPVRESKATWDCSMELECQVAARSAAFVSNASGSSQLRLPSTSTDNIAVRMRYGSTADKPVLSTPGERLTGPMERDRIMHSIHESKGNQ
jgi:hypothetical protein